MSKMVDLKKSKTEQKSNDIPASIGHNDYSYGTQLELGDHELGKLGVDTLPKVGDKMHLHARGEVTSVSQSAHKSGEKNRRVSIQIKKMKLMPKDPEDAVDAINGGIEEAGE